MEKSQDTGYRKINGRSVINRPVISSAFTRIKKYILLIQNKNSKDSVYIVDDDEDG